MTLVDGNGKPANGESTAGEQPYVVTLTMPRDHSAMHVAGNCLGDLELVLDLLGRATRYFDMQYRIVAAQNYNDSLAQQRQNADLAKKLGFGGR